MLGYTGNSMRRHTELIPAQQHSIVVMVMQLQQRKHWKDLYREMICQDIKFSRRIRTITHCCYNSQQLRTGHGLCKGHAVI